MLETLCPTSTHFALLSIIWDSKFYLPQSLYSCGYICVSNEVPYRRPWEWNCWFEVWSSHVIMEWNGKLWLHAGTHDVYSISLFAMEKAILCACTTVLQNNMEPHICGTMGPHHSTHVHPPQHQLYISSIPPQRTRPAPPTSGVAPYYSAAQ